jgi:hypothetical protein
MASILEPEVVAVTPVPPSWSAVGTLSGGISIPPGREAPKNATLTLH